LLSEHNAEYDEVEAIIRTPKMVREKIPQAALHFVALLLRLADFLLLREEHVESTFKEDAARRIKQQIGGRAIIKESEPVSRSLAEITPDMVLHAENRDPVAVFFAQSSPRVYEAMILQMDALYVAKEPLSVIALLEAENSISRDMQKKASNRL